MKTIIRFIQKWNEILVVPIAFLIFYFSAPLLRCMDPTAAVYDYGIFQILLFATVGFFFAIGIVRIGMKFFSPRLEKFIDNKLPEIWEDNNITLWQKSKLAVFLFSLYLLVFVLLARII